MTHYPAVSDVLAGGQNPENSYQIDSDDFYNDIGHDFAFIGFDTDNYGTVYAPSASTLKAVSSIMINGDQLRLTRVRLLMMVHVW